MTNQQNQIVPVPLSEFLALKADAQRYRWLRACTDLPAVFSTPDDPEPLSGPELDVAIDERVRK